MKTYRIKPGVKPYAGKVLEEKTSDENSVTGFVRVSSAKYATSQRTYRRDELTEV